MTLRIWFGEGALNETFPEVDSIARVQEASMGDLLEFSKTSLRESTELFNQLYFINYSLEVH